MAGESIGRNYAPPVGEIAIRDVNAQQSRLPSGLHHPAKPAPWGRPAWRQQVAAQIEVRCLWPEVVAMSVDGAHPPLGCSMAASDVRARALTSVESTSRRVALAKLEGAHSTVPRTKPCLW